ncbi:hypothetical protein NL526_30295, partial [Klebsiella pneumoniae]|nr:hypothetical protein [Klebsiella pneumoniae]
GIKRKLIIIMQTSDASQKSASSDAPQKICLNKSGEQETSNDAGSIKAQMLGCMHIGTLSSVQR